MDNLQAILIGNLVKKYFRISLIYWSTASPKKLAKSLFLTKSSNCIYKTLCVIIFYQLFYLRSSYLTVNLIFLKFFLSVPFICPSPPLSLTHLHVPTTGHVTNVVLRSDLGTRPFLKVQLNGLDFLITSPGLVARILQRPNLTLGLDLQFVRLNLQVQAVTANHSDKGAGGNGKEPNLGTETQTTTTSGLSSSSPTQCVRRHGKQWPIS